MTFFPENARALDIFRILRMLGVSFSGILFWMCIWVQTPPTPGAYISKTARVSGVQFSFLNNTGHTKRYSVFLGIMKDYGLLLQNRYHKRIPGALYLWASVQNTKYKVQQFYNFWLFNSSKVRTEESIP